MKKNLSNFFKCLIIPVLLSSCSFPLMIKEKKQIQETDNSISVTYFKKDAKDSFFEFLNTYNENTSNAFNSRSVNSDEQGTELSEEDQLFFQIWSELSEEERDYIINNINDVDISFESGISVDLESPLGRSVKTEGTKNIENLAEYYGIIETIKDIGKNKKVPVSFLGEDFYTAEVDDVNADAILELYLRNCEWEKFNEILTYIGESKSYASLRKRWEELNYAWNSSIATSRSSSNKNDDDYATMPPLVENAGDQLYDGDVVLTINRKKAWVVAGDWSHGGIFSKDLYTSSREKDFSYCVYTAEPTKNKSKKQEEDEQEEEKYENENTEKAYYEPDRYGYACMETLANFTKAKRFAAIHPINYTENAAKNAINQAKTIYYDAKAPYHLPWYEIFYLGNTSHDLKSTNTYCTKIPYTAWKLNNVDIDSNIFAGNLVSPDDIYGSSVKRFVTIQIILLFKPLWTKTIVLYEPTTTVLVEKSR